jgi:propionyl-CoA:succinyl-CoA transferase
MSFYGPYPLMSAEEAVSNIKNGNTVAFSGFSPAGGAKAAPRALAQRAEREHADWRPFRLRVLTGASAGQHIDEDLAKGKAVAWRAPYQQGPTLRKQINQGEVEYVDMHLSHMPQAVAFGFFGPIDVAVIEATEITPDGRVYLSSSIGASPTFLQHAKRVIIEINHYHSQRLREMHDIIMMPTPPHRTPIQVYEPLTRVGWPYAMVDPKKVMAVVETNEADSVADFDQPDETSRRIADHIVSFLIDEMKAGRIPKEFLPLQAGVGNVANGVLASLGAHPDVPPFYMYSEVFQDSMAAVMMQGRLLGASATSLTVTAPVLKNIVENIDFFNKRIVLRPQEISNHPGVIRRLGVIGMNTAVEFDIYGNVNSSHVYGMDVINGIGGSGDFTRNTYLSFFMAPSVAKGGKISAVVPMTPHVDNNEHSVQIVVTEQGLADLRGVGPAQRAQMIIEKCAHPMYKDYLRKYVRDSRGGHIRHDLIKCFQLHRNLLQTGSMLPELNNMVNPLGAIAKKAEVKIIKSSPKYW